jgi:hypothetical protein
LASLALGLSALAGIALTSAVPASAAGPSHLPYQGSAADFPTWIWSPTTLCVTNHGWNPGRAKVQSRSPFARPEYLTIRPSSMSCITRSWWGVPVTVTNVGSTPLVARSY